MRDIRTNIRDALENHEENKNKDLSSTICEFVSLECTPQVRYNTTEHEYKDCWIDDCVTQTTKLCMMDWK